MKTKRSMVLVSSDPAQHRTGRQQVFEALREGNQAVRPAG